MTTVLETSGHDATWHLERRQSLGASEVPMVLGESLYGDARKVFLLKKGLIEPDAENDAMLIGTLAEPMLAELYFRKTGFPFVRTQYRVRHPVDSFMTATLDGVRSDRRHVELKTTGVFTKAAKALGRVGSQEIPFEWELQCQAQMHCFETDECDLAVLIAGQDFRIYPVRRNNRLLAVMLPLLRDFWGQVERNECPESTGQDTPETLAAINPDVDGSFPLSPQAVAAAARYEELGKVEKEAKEERERIKAELLCELGTLEYGLLPDGRRLKRFREVYPSVTKTVTTKGFTKHYLKIVKGEFA
jgi:putative phage-type endonuclease